MGDDKKEDEDEPEEQHVEDCGMLVRMRMKRLGIRMTMRLRMRISTWRVMRMMIRMMRCE